MGKTYCFILYLSSFPVQWKISSVYLHVVLVSIISCPFKLNCDILLRDESEFLSSFGPEKQLTKLILPLMFLFCCSAQNRVYVNDAGPDPECPLC